MVSCAHLDHLPWGMGHRDSGLKEINKADGKQLWDLSGHYDRGQVSNCDPLFVPCFFFFFFPVKQECELVKKKKKN